MTNNDGSLSVYYVVHNRTHHFMSLTILEVITFFLILFLILLPNSFFISSPTLLSSFFHYLSFTLSNLNHDGFLILSPSVFFSVLAIISSSGDRGSSGYSGNKPHHRATEHKERLGPLSSHSRFCYQSELL